MIVRRSFEYRDSYADSIRGVGSNGVLRGCAGKEPLGAKWDACKSKADIYSFAVGWVGGIEGSRYWSAVSDLYSLPHPLVAVVASLLSL
jgi:hypothetical protein